LFCAQASSIVLATFDTKLSPSAFEKSGYQGVFYIPIDLGNVVAAKEFIKPAYCYN